VQDKHNSESFAWSARTGQLIHSAMMLHLEDRLRIYIHMQYTHLIGQFSSRPLYNCRKGNTTRSSMQQTKWLLIQINASLQQI